MTSGTTFAAMRGNLGSTTYYIVSLKANDLVHRTTIPKEITEWSDLSIEERYQRDINYSRVRRQIAPYMARDEDRFFGAIILAAWHLSHNAWEPLSAVVRPELPNLYQAATRDLGFLTLSGGELLVPLDGQHRLKAIEFALDGRGEKNQQLALSPSVKLANDDVTALIVPHERSKARQIFTHVNRYARPTTRGQNIVTDDDDVFAVITRRIANEIIGGPLAKYTNNALTPTDPEFTTLSIVYNCNKEIVSKHFPVGRIDTSKLPEPSKQQLFEEKCVEIWTWLAEGIEVFALGLEDREASGNEGRQLLRKENLLGKPVAQECLVRAFVDLTIPPTNLAYRDACDRLNRLPWAITEENLTVWDQVLWSGGVDGKVLTKNRKLATRLVYHIAGGVLEEWERQQLLEDYRKIFPEARRKELQLPEPVER